MKDVNAMIPFEDFLDAYKDCRRRKRGTTNALAFEVDYLTNLYQLYQDVNSRTYEIGRSICFVVTRPKPREVFAADFRDRVIHHLVIGKLNSIFEDYFIDDTYNCRVGKGVLFGVRRLHEKIRNVSNWGTADAYVARFDISGFFMHISRPLLLSMLLTFVDERYKGKDKETVKYLVEKIAMHSPERNCIRKSPEWKWGLLGEGKSLFTCEEMHGLPIGNLSSQVFANFYLTGFDLYMQGIFGDGYGRYVDDFFIVSDDKRKILSRINEIKERLQALGLTLHPDKIYLQHYTKGVPFIGSFVLQNRILPGKRIIANAFVAAKRDYATISELLSSANSYLGFLRQYKSFNLRIRFTNALYKKYGRYIYSTANLLTVKARYNYAKTNKQITVQPDS